MEHKDRLRTSKPHRTSRWERARAVQVVADAARDAEECAELLAMLGLDAADGVSRVERAS